MNDQRKTICRYIALKKEAASLGLDLILSDGLEGYFELLNCKNATGKVIFLSLDEIELILKGYRLAFNEEK